jgi:hypothetical protein
MSQWLVHCASPRLVESGQDVRNKLQADSRLAEVAAYFEPHQLRLESRNAAHLEAVRLEGSKAAEYDDAVRELRDGHRDLGLGLLAITRNHTDADLYRHYFPDGYGEATGVDETVLAVLTETVLSKLADETDPRILAFRDRITSARDAFTAAAAGHEAAARGRKLAFEHLDAEKVKWARAVLAARHRAEEILPEDKAYLRWVFRTVLQRSRRGAGEEPSAQAVAEPPDIGAGSADALAASPEAGGSSAT